MKRYEVTITGSTPLLMHWDNIEWSDRMEAWKNNPANKKGSKAGAPIRGCHCGRGEHDDERDRAAEATTADAAAGAWQGYLKRTPRSAMHNGARRSRLQRP